MNNVKNLFHALNQRPIAYYPIYRMLTGSTTAGILLSQLMYWHSAVGRKFYKTDEEIREETGLTLKELKTAKKVLKKLDFLLITLENMPAKTYYDVDYTLLSIAITTVWPKGTNKMDRKGPTRWTERDQHTIYTENTTENTTENILSLSAKDDPKPKKYDIECKEILSHLNKVANRGLQVEGKRAKANYTIIKQRLKEGYSVEDLKKIINCKAQEWRADVEMKKFLKPSTLFIPKHISDYLHEAEEGNATGQGAGLTFDIDLNGKTDAYKQFFQYLERSYPETARAVPFLKASEYQRFLAERPDWFPMYWDRVSKQVHQGNVKEVLNTLEASPQERKKAATGLFTYLTNNLKQMV